MDDESVPEALDLGEALRRMLLIRAFETRVSRLYRDNVLKGMIHVSLGQEASSVGVCLALTEGDFLTSTHRGHGHCLARGMSPDRMMAELYGRTTGYCHGKGGSMHIADPSLGVLGANGIVGAGVPIAAGAALACKMRGSGVVVAFFGEGAATTGAFHEAANLAAIWDLPLLLACENNQYVEFSPISSLMRAEHVSDLSRAYGIESRHIDGTDVEATYEAAYDLIAQLRQGRGPFLLEMDTLRFDGHYVGDPQNYRPADDLARLHELDPVLRCRQAVISRGLLTEQDVNALQGSVDDEIERAVTFAVASPTPTVDEVWLDV